MKTLRLLTLSALLSVTALAEAPVQPFHPPFEPDPGVLAAPDIESAWKPLAQMNNMDYLLGQIGDAKGADREMAVRKLFLRSLRLSAAFYQKYPSDPRRWFAVREMAGATKALANPDGTPKGAVEGLVWDNAAWAVWFKEIQVLDAAIATAPDAPVDFKLTAESAQPGGVRSLFAAANKAIQAKEPFDFAPVKAELFRLAAKYPTVKSFGSYVSTYVQFRNKAGATKEELMAELKEFAAQPNESFSAGARKEIDKLTMMGRPLEIAFTAVDGRKVDLKDLRGKVVLVDFWATWCGPCVKELPNVKKVYAAYRDLGFEVVGIALENARLSATDTPEQTAAKLEMAKTVLTDFTTKEQMAWPQYFDGKFWKNDISTRFGIGSIPAMFLIDQNGKLVTTEARGPKLEAEVKRLLKL